MKDKFFVIHAVKFTFLEDEKETSNFVDFFSQDLAEAERISSVLKALDYHKVEISEWKGGEN